MVFDTCLLIDLQRELRKGTQDRAWRFLREATGPFFISLITREEFLEGFNNDQRPFAEQFLQPYRVIVPGPESAWTCSRLLRRARETGTPMSDHDAWIATSCLEEDLPLVTRNLAHFSPVPGLRCIGY